MSGSFGLAVAFFARGVGDAQVRWDVQGYVGVLPGPSVEEWLVLCSKLCTDLSLSSKLCIRTKNWKEVNHTCNARDPPIR